MTNREATRAGMKGARTEARATARTSTNTPEREAWARQKAQEELAQLKQNNSGELSLSSLENNGISREDMQHAVTTGNITEIHAGPKAKKLAAKSQQIDSQRAGSGYCASATADSLQQASKIDIRTPSCSEKPVQYRENGQIKSSRHNGTNQTRAMRKNKEFYTFDFPNNTRCGNPEIAKLTEPGTFIGWEAAANATQPLGHTAIMGSDGNWHCDCTQSPKYMSGTTPAQRYQSTTYTIGFTDDCTVSDKLAEEMLYQKYLREGPEATQSREATKQQMQTQSRAARTRTSRAPARRSQSRGAPARKTQARKTQARKAPARKAPARKTQVRKTQVRRTGRGR